MSNSQVTKSVWSFTLVEMSRDKSFVMTYKFYETLIKCQQTLEDEVLMKCIDCFIDVCIAWPGKDEITVLWMSLGCILHLIKCLCFKLIKIEYL